MSLGFVEIDGRRYKIKYKDPDDSDVSSEFNKLKHSAGTKYNPETDKDSFTNRAKAIAAGKKYEAASREAYKYAAIIVSKLEDLKAEPGISQRRTGSISVEENSGGVLKSIELISGNESDSPRVITDDRVKKSLTTLADKLNKLNYDSSKNRSNPKEDTFIEVPAPDYSKPIPDQIEDFAYWFSGAGDKDHQFALEMTRLNRFNKSMLPTNRELVGYTFITRPHCNLANENLVNVRDFAPLLFCNPNSIQMAIRQSLDTEFAYNHGGSKFNCPLIDIQNPFFVMCCNSLRSITNFPDPTLAIETTEGGFFSEQQSGVIGYDRMAKGQDLQLTFRDYVGSPVMSAIDFWVKYMGYIQDGTMHQYKEDIEHNLFGYSVSIYRFLLDYSGRRITRWAKATGCWPKMSPMGTIFNINDGETIVAAAKDNFSVPFQASVFEYNDPEILRDFNILVRRYCAGISDGEPIGGSQGDVKSMLPDLKTSILNNKAGIPYVTFRYGAPELVWKVPVHHVNGVGAAVRTPTVGDSYYKEPNDPDNQYLNFPH